MKRYIILILIIMSCKQKYSPLNDLYEKMENDLDKGQVNEFKELPANSVLSFEPFWYSNVINTCFDEIQNNELFIEDFEKRKIPHIKYLNQFIVIFHMTLNNVTIDSNSVKQYFVEINEKFEIVSDKQSALSKNKRLSFIRANWEKYKIGEKVKFELPFENRYNKNIITYGNNGQLDDENPNFANSTTVSGYLLRKIIPNPFDRIDSINSRFDIIIDSVGQELFKSQYFGEPPSKCIKGDTFHLSLELYGNRILN